MDCWAERLEVLDFPYLVLFLPTVGPWVPLGHCLTG